MFGELETFIDRLADMVAERVLAKLERREPRHALLRPEEFASLCGLSRTRVYALLGEGLPAVRVGCSRRIDPDAGVAWLRRRTEVSSAQ